MKQKLILLVVLVLILSAILYLHSFFYPSTYSKGSYASQINSGINLYTRTEIQSLGIPGYFLLDKVNKITDTVPWSDMAYLQYKYKDNPYKRLMNKNDYTSNISFKRKKNTPKDFDYYVIENVQDPTAITGWDGIILRALYCDKTGYDEADFDILSLLKKNIGDYEDTHYLLGLVLLKENHCYKEKLLDGEIKKTAMVIINRQNQNQPFSDIFVERIALLYWAGFGQDVKKEWIESVTKSYSKNYGWRDKTSKNFNTHTTGLSLLSLLYYSEEKDKQPIY